MGLVQWILTTVYTHITPTLPLQFHQFVDLIWMESFIMYF